MKNNTYNYFNMYDNFWGPDAPSYTPEKLNAQRKAMTRTEIIAFIVTIIMAFLTVKMVGECGMMNYAVPGMGTILTTAIGYLTLKTASAVLMVHTNRKRIAEILDDYDNMRERYFEEKRLASTKREEHIPFSNPLCEFNWKW